MNTRRKLAKRIEAMERFVSYVRIFAQASSIVLEALSLGMAMARFVIVSSVQTVEQGYMQKSNDNGLYNPSRNNYLSAWTHTEKQEFINFLVLTGMLSTPLIVFGLCIFLREKRNVLFPYVRIVLLIIGWNGFVSILKTGFWYWHAITKERVPADKHKKL